MDIPITRAQDHSISGAASYCDVNDVRQMLASVEPDDAATELSGWLSRENADTIIAEYYLPLSLRRFTQWAKRDFLLHEEVDVLLDGNGLDTLDLGELGFAPLVDILSLTIGTTAQTLDNYVATKDGILRVKTGSIVGTTIIRFSPTFPVGVGNIALNLSWGYADAPEDVVAAQAQLAAVYVLMHLERAQSAAPGMVGGVQQVIYDDFRVVNYQQGRYANSIKMLLGVARKVALSYRTPGVSGLVPHRGHDAGIGFYPIVEHDW